MKPAPHWPLHPAPREGEALSSWLNRVALCYHMEVSELLEHDLGHGQVDDLDTAPPLALLAMLSQRSGIEPDRLRCMSFAGWVPWLLDSLDDQIPDALKPMRSSSRCCCRNSAVGRDPSRAGVPGCPASRYIAPARSV
ncbi:TniQ family protein [Escherichia coli]|uniref:TniQ family protein n=2 Tax=Enterobacteriaceae TaxID=543 RepID=UPI0038905748